MTGDRKPRSTKSVAPIVRQRSHELRQAMSAPEQTVLKHLRAHRFHGLGFRRQVPIAGYIVDFVCHERRLIVEIDGSTHGDDNAARRDQVRTRCLEGEGYRVVRYWNNDIMTNLEGVLLDLASQLGLQELPPNPSLVGERVR